MVQLQDMQTHWEGMEGNCCFVFFRQAVQGPQVLQGLAFVHIKYNTAESQNPRALCYTAATRSSKHPVSTARLQVQRF